MSISASSLLREVLDRKACNALTSEGLTPVLLLTLIFCCLPEAFPEEVAKALYVFPPRTRDPLSNTEQLAAMATCLRSGRLAPCARGCSQT